MNALNANYILRIDFQCLETTQDACLLKVLSPLQIQETLESMCQLKYCTSHISQCCVKKRETLTVYSVCVGYFNSESTLMTVHI